MTINAGDTPDADDLNALGLPGTAIAWGQRTSSVTFTGTEIGVLRLDSVSLQAGYRYEVRTSNLRVNMTSGETTKLFLRVNTAGTATTSSTVLVSAEGNANSTFTPAQAPVLSVTYAPGAVTASFLISLGRSGGSNNTTITGSSIQPIEMWIVNLGTDPGDTGVDV
jgi:hypothetical protein